MDLSVFYKMLRRKDSGLFGTSLSQSQVEGLEAVLKEGQRRAIPLTHFAYILATDYHETGRTMQPVRENLNYSVAALKSKFSRQRISIADAERYGRKPGRPADQMAIANTIYGGEWGRVHLGNTQPGDGWVYRGGGLPQLTGRANFGKFGIADNPDAITDMETAVRVMFDGMIDGLFTGLKLSDFGDYKLMRKTVNGTDAADEIATHAVNFEKALHAAGYDQRDAAATAELDADLEIAFETEMAKPAVEEPETPRIDPPAPESAPPTGRRTLLIGVAVAVTLILIFILAKG